jgi:hypothetical protein
MGVDMDGLAYPLPDEGTGTSARHCLVLSLQWAVVPFGGCEAPPLGVDIHGELFDSMSALLNLTWGKSFVP